MKLKKIGNFPLFRFLGLTGLSEGDLTRSPQLVWKFEEPGKVRIFRGGFLRQLASFQILFSRFWCRYAFKWRLKSYVPSCTFFDLQFNTISHCHCNFFNHTLAMESVNKIKKIQRKFKIIVIVRVRRKKRKIFSFPCVTLDCNQLQVLEL